MRFVRERYLEQQVELFGYFKQHPITRVAKQKMRLICELGRSMSTNSKESHDNLRSNTKGLIFACVGL